MLRATQTSPVLNDALLPPLGPASALPLHPPRVHVTPVSRNAHVLDSLVPFKAQSKVKLHLMQLELAGK